MDIVELERRSKMKKILSILVIVSLACVVGACGNSTSADFDRWTFYNEMYAECISACEACTKLDSVCGKSSVEQLSCVDQLWREGASIMSCEGTERDISELADSGVCPDNYLYNMCFSN